MAASLEHKDFVRYLNTNFRVLLDDVTAEVMELIEVSDLIESPQESGFSIVFRGPAERILTQGTRHFESPEMGEFDLFIVPVRKDEKGVYYEAIFNRLRPKDE
jgi:hypothetical protein